MPSWLTVALTGVLTVAPQVLPFVPPPIGTGISAAVAVLGAVYHLLQPEPGCPTVRTR